MKKTIVILLLLFTQKNALIGQSNLTGYATDKLNNPISFCLIFLKTAENAPKKPSYSVFADSLGFFHFSKIPFGNYVLQVTALGFDTLSKKINIVGDSMYLEPIVLNPSVKTLESVTVTARKNLFERKIDRLVFNIENSPIAANGSVWESLNKIPGVRTESSGGITANGKSVNVYINNRPVRLSAEEASEILKNLPATNISKIEVITNPPASYDAQGGAVINIVYKKNGNEGLYLTLRSAVTFSTYPKYSESVNFNVRKNKFNLFGMYIYRNKKDLSLEDGFIDYGNAYWEIVKNRINTGNTHNYRVGLDYDLNRKSSLGIAVDGYSRVGGIDINAQTDALTQQRNSVDSILKTRNFGNSGQSNYSLNLNYKAQLDTNGRSITADFDYSTYKDSRIRYVTNNTYSPINNTNNASFDVKQTPQQQIDIYSFKSDYAQPISVNASKFSLLLGIKMVKINTKSDIIFEQKKRGNYEKDTARSNDFSYSETIHAAYLNLSGRIGKWETQVGLRGENTQTASNSLVLGQTNGSAYFELFPSVYFQRIFKDHTLNFSYSKRIDRPNFSQLNAFKSYTSPFFYSEGNPLLAPEFIHSVSFSYAFTDKYNVNVSYNDIRNVKSEVTIQNNAEKTIKSTYKNLDNSAFLGVSLTANNRLLKWWDVSTFVQIRQKRERNMLFNEDFTRSIWDFYASINQAFTLSKDKSLTGEINVWYGSESIKGINLLGKSWELSCGINKKFNKKKGNLGITVNDILYSNVDQIASVFGSQKNGTLQRNDTRAVTISLSYAFGNAKFRENKKRKAGNEEEKNRSAF